MGGRGLWGSPCWLVGSQLAVMGERVLFLQFDSKVVFVAAVCRALSLLVSETLSRQAQVQHKW